HGARAPEPRLYLVEDEHHVVLLAPRRQALRILFRHEVRTHALIRFADHARHAGRRDALALQGFEEQIEARILRAVAVRKRDEVDIRIQVYDPLALTGQSAD